MYVGGCYSLTLQIVTLPCTSDGIPIRQREKKRKKSQSPILYITQVSYRQGGGTRCGRYHKDIQWAGEDKVEIGKVRAK